MPAPRVLTGTAAFSSTVEAPGIGEKGNSDTFARALQTLINNDVSLAAGGGGGGGGFIDVAVDAGDSPYDAPSGKYAVDVDTSGGPVAIGIGATPVDGDEVIVKDVSGNAGANNITISANHHIDTATFGLTIAEAYGAVWLRYNAAAFKWMIVARYPAAGGSVFTSGAEGLVPASGGGTVNFLRADGAWEPPIAGGTGGEIAVCTAPDTYGPFPGLRASGDATDWSLSAIHTGSDRQVLGYTDSTALLEVGGPAINELQIVSKKIGLGGALLASNHHTDITLGATVSNYNAAGWADAFVARLAPASADSTIEGFGSGGVGSQGQIKVVFNVSATHSIIVAHNTSGVPQNRVWCATESDLTVAPGEAFILVYDYGSTIWRAMRLAGSGSPTLAAVLAAGSIAGDFDINSSGQFSIEPVSSAAGAGDPIAFVAQSSGSANGAGGNAALSAGSGHGTGAGGSATLAAGDGGATGAGGTIYLQPGLGNAGAGARGVIHVWASRIVSLADPVDPQDAATKAYVDITAGGGGGSIPDDAVTNAKLANMATARIKGRVTAGTGDPEDLTGTQATTLLDVFSDSLKGLAPASGGGAVNFLRADGTWATPAGNGVPNDNSVTMAKLADIATDRLIGRDTAGTGDPEAISVAGGLEFTGSGGIQRSALTGDVTASAGSGATTIANLAVSTGKIANDAVTYAKIQNVSVTDRLLGRDTAAAGDIEELTVGGGIEFTGSGGIQRSALTGDVTATAGSNATTIANDAVTTLKIASGAINDTRLASNSVATAKIVDDAVTYAKIQDVTVTDRLLGRDTAGAGIVEELTVSGGLEFSGAGGIQRSALTGDVTAAAGSNATTIANLAVSSGKLANDAVATAKIADAAVTYAKIQDVSAASRLLGRGSAAGAGDVQELTIGSGLALTGTVLSASGGGGGGESLAATLALGNTTGGLDIRCTLGDQIQIEGDDNDYDIALIEVEAGAHLAINAPAGITTVGAHLKLRGGLGNAAADGNVIIDRGLLDLGSKRIISVANPTSAQDAVTKAYADSLATVTGGTENVSVNLLPATQTVNTLATTASATFDTATATGKRYTLSAQVWVENGSGAYVFFKDLVVWAHNNGGTLAIVKQSEIGSDGTGYTFVASVSGTNIRLTLSNTSGSTGTYQVLIGSIVADKP